MPGSDTKLDRPLRTPRTVLTPAVEDDADALLALLNDPVVRRYLLDDNETDRAWIDEIIADSRAAFARGEPGLYVAREAPGGELVALTGFREFFDPPVRELLYALAPSHHRRGLATEIAREMLRVGFDEADLEIIRASTDAPNETSIRVLERLGFEETGREPGVAHETIHFALERKRWLGQRSEP